MKMVVVLFYVTFFFSPVLRAHVSVRKIHIRGNPAGTRRQNNVVRTLFQRFDVQTKNQEKDFKIQLKSQKDLVRLFVQVLYPSQTTSF